MAYIEPVTNWVAGNIPASSDLNRIEGNNKANHDDRITGDNNLQNNINAEAATRLANDGTLQDNIDAEATTRLANDGTLQDNIDAEATTRLANDNAEAFARITKDNALDARIDGIVVSLGIGSFAMLYINSSSVVFGQNYTGLGLVGIYRGLDGTTKLDFGDPVAGTWRACFQVTIVDVLPCIGLFMRVL